MSQCDDEQCPSHQRYLEADTARLLYKNRLQEVGKNLEQQGRIAATLSTALENLKASIDECISVTRRLEIAETRISDDNEADDAKQG